MNVNLKIKIKSLAAESRIIRHEERGILKHRDFIRQAVEQKQGAETKVAELDMRYSSLRSHRVNVVRSEARAAHVAYAFLRGKKFSSVEQPGSEGLVLGSVVRLVSAHGRDMWPRGVAEAAVKEWVEHD